MNNEKKIWLWAGWVASYLQRSLSANVKGGGVQMPSLTAENSHFLRSGSQEALVMRSPFFMGNVYFMGECNGDIDDLYILQNVVAFARLVEITDSHVAWCKWMHLSIQCIYGYLCVYVYKSTRSRRYFREEVFPWFFLFKRQFHALVFHRMKSSSD